jgi:hypothetical protein
MWKLADELIIRRLFRRVCGQQGVSLLYCHIEVTGVKASGLCSCFLYRTTQFQACRLFINGESRIDVIELLRTFGINNEVLRFPR